MIDPILRPRRVCELLGVSRATLYNMIDRDELAKPMKIGPQAVGWPESVIAAYIERKKDEAGYESGAVSESK